MTRNLPEPSPTISARAESRRSAHAMLDELFDYADLHRTTGEMQLVLVMNEGGVRDSYTVKKEKSKPKAS